MESSCVKNASNDGYFRYINKRINVLFYNCFYKHFIKFITFYKLPDCNTNIKYLVLQAISGFLNSFLACKFILCFILLCYTVDVIVPAYQSMQVSMEGMFIIMIKKNYKEWFPITVKDLFITLGILTCATIICVSLRIFDDGNIYVAMIFLLAVLLISRFTTGYLYGILASILGVIGINYFFTLPYYEFNLTMGGYPITIIITLLVSIITSTMTTQIKEKEKLKMIAKKEKMRVNLLRAISHDLRTPLTSILGASSAILENDDVFDKEVRKELLSEIKEDSQWLIRLVENLLSITRFSDGIGKLNKSQEVAEEIAAEAVIKFKKRYHDITVSISVPDEILFVSMDPILIEQVLINLMENSIRHGKTTSKIDLSITKLDAYALFSVKDDGEGIKKKILQLLFTDNSDKSKEAESDSTKNMGIGLSVCLSIIKSHGGKMTAKNIEPKGAIVSFYLPLEEDTNV